MQIVRVVLVPPLGRLGALDYVVPDEHGLVEPGTRVLVPIGSRRSMGVVVGPSEEREPNRLRDIIAVLDERPLFDAELLALIEWMADYYLASSAEAMMTALPGVLRVETERIVSLAGESGDVAVRSLVARDLMNLLRAEGPQSVRVLQRRLGAGASATVARLRARGIVRVVERVRRESAPTRYLRFYEVSERLADDDPRWKRRPALLAVYRYLREHPMRKVPAQELRNAFPHAEQKLRDLTAAGLIRCRREEEYRVVLPPTAVRDRRVTLTEEQQRAVDTLVAAEGFFPALLFGVTGSGKTEVYLRVVAEMMKREKTALILVPEISLTHQLVDRVRARFGDAAAVLHSQLSDGERWDEWRRIARGEASIVVGARSAIFAPLAKLGVIIVDEEHDAAYKQADGVHYNGRDVAVMRAKLSKCVLLLGSATPSMESFHNAQTGRYRLLELPRRVGSRPLPQVEVLDLRGSSSPPPISRPLAAAIDANLAAGGQTLLFLNRRGFANFLQCRACGEPVMCPNCSVTLTSHRHWRALRCHYCDYTIAPPPLCGECHEPALHEWGVGTEQLERMLAEMFPAARLGRMDRDTTRRKGSLQSILAKWAARKLDVLIGTQMVTKGHDIPGVTLVGVVLADQSLSFPDFRAPERTFQLLAQVAGRAGRGDAPGRVLVQTLQPEHYSLRAAREHDFRGFAERELASRRDLAYPPFSRLVLLRIEGEQSAAVERIAADMAKLLRELAGRDFGVLGPAPAPIERLRQRYRRQILLRGKSGARLRRAAATVVEDVRDAARQHDVRLIVDVDPQHML